MKEISRHPSHKHQLNTIYEDMGRCLTPHKVSYLKSWIWSTHKMTQTFVLCEMSAYVYVKYIGPQEVTVPACES